MRTPAVAIVAIALSPLPSMAQSPAIHQCKSIVQGRIDVLDAEMRKGDKANQAHKLLKRRDRLRAQYMACETNPNAYKKEL